MNKRVLAAVFTTLCWGVTASAFQVNLETRPSAVPNSCEWGVFQAEFKLTNVDAGAREPHSYVIHLGFNAEEDIVPVHSEVYANVFDARGGYVGSTVAHLLPALDVEGALESRFANQHMRVYFDRVAPPGFLTIPQNGGYMTLTVTYQRGDGLYPFDPECDDFSRIDPGTPYAFVDNPYFYVDYVNTQPLCEYIAPGQVDPNGGLWLTGESFCRP